MIEGAEKVILPESIEDFDESSMFMLMNGVKELYVKCTGVFELPASQYAMGFVDFLSAGIQDLTDVYFYAFDVNDIIKITYYDERSWGEATSPLIFHVGSQNIVDRFYADDIYKKQIDTGKLFVVKDLDVTYDGRRVLPSMVKKAKEYTADMEGDYNKASWAALQAALASAETYLR